MVWHDAVRQEQINLLLYQIGMAPYGLKQASIDSVAQTEVNNDTVYWIKGGHRGCFLPLARPELTWHIQRAVPVWLAWIRKIY